MKSIAWAIIIAALIWETTYIKVHLNQRPDQAGRTFGLFVLVCFIISVFL